MSTVAVSRLVDAPVDRVWAVFTDLASRAEWLSTVDDVQLVTAGPFEAGTVWRETRTMSDGERVTEEFHVQECDPPRRFVVASAGIGAEYRMTYTFAPVEVGRHRGGTAVTVVQDGHPSAPAGRLLAFLLGGLAAAAVEGAFRKDLADLARAAAAGGPGRGAAAAADTPNRA
jgi:uncharacterized protein YndB with AHSA1/START domain